MAVVNSIAERIEGTRIIIKTALIRNNKMAKDIEEKNNAFQYVLCKAGKNRQTEIKRPLAIG